MDFNGYANKGEIATNASRLKLVGAYNFESEVIREQKPVFLSCFDRNIKFEKRKEAINSISKIFGDALKVCVLKEDFIGVFKEKYNIYGTPTFLVFFGGEEKDRMLGQADQETLKSFIAHALSDIYSKYE